MYDATRYRDYVEHQFTYRAGFQRNVRRFASHIAMVDPPTGRQWTYRQLGADVARLASALHDRGVGRGDRVVFQLPNVPEFALSWLAAPELGAIAAPINYRLAPGEIAHILRDCEPGVVVVDAACSAVMAEALDMVGGSRPRVIVADPGATRTPDGLEAELFDQVLASASGEVPPLPADVSTYDETTRLYTSGTTGMPKGVPLPSLVEVLSAHDVIMHFPLGPTDRTLNMTPWFHRGGLYSGGPNPCFYVGAGVVPMKAFNPATALDWVGEHQITFLIGAPTSLQMLAAEQERTPRDLSHLRGIVTMGAPLDRAAAVRYQEVLTPRIFNGYGTTEAFWNTFLRPEDLPAHAGTAGRACTDDDVAVVKMYDDRRAEPDDLAVQDGTEHGEIIMRSPKSGFAYANLPDVEEERFWGGWLYTGDVGTWDEDGFVTIVGRKDDMIISGGENVHPVQVEEVLEEHPGVRESVVVGIPDEHWGQRVVAYVVPAEGAGELDVAALDKHCRSHPRLAAFKRPRAYRFVDELPHTATGKKIHYQVTEQATQDAQEGTLTPTGTTDTHE
ncbi:MAG TPA: AMP-binding protein [Segeticoccus sp.]|nr:AMP-binding protein [Segeticoccus sp.]